MNDHYYYSIICEYIPKKHRVICSTRDRYLITYKRNYKHRLLLASIYLHRGTPCCRYCICRYFNEDDLLNLYISI